MPHAVDLIPGPVDLLDPADRIHPANAGKVAWWLGLEGTAAGPTARDLIGTNGAALVNGAAWVRPTRPGGSAELIFDGTDDYAGPVTIPAINSTAAGFSVTLWFLGNTTVNDGGRLIEKGANDEWAINWSGSTGAHIQVQSFTEGSALDSTAAYSDGLWHHLALVHEPGVSYRLYIDGRFDVSNPAGTSSTSTGAVTIGSFGGGGFFLHSGRLDDIAIYSRSLSASEVAALYDLSRRGYPEGLNRVDLGVSLFGSGAGGAAFLAPRRRILPQAVRRASSY